MRVVHANWTRGALWLWAEHADWRPRDPEDAAAEPAPAVLSPLNHPGAVTAVDLASTLAAEGLNAGAFGKGTVTIRLPAFGESPLPSPAVAHATGHAATLAAATAPPRLAAFEIEALRVRPDDAYATLDRLDEIAGRASDELASERDAAEPALDASDSVRFFATAARLVRSMLAQQRFVPMLAQSAGGELAASWRPWWSDEATAARTSELLGAMPASARAVADGFEHEPWSILQDFMGEVGDAMCREALRREQMAEAIEGRDSAADAHVAWLTGLLDGVREAPARPEKRASMISAVRRWIGRLDDRGADVGWRLCLRLAEPIIVDDEVGADERATWRLSFHLQSVESEHVLLEASEVWALTADVASVDGRRIEAPRQVLLAELGRASRLYDALEGALDQSEPTGIDLDTRRAYLFLREVGPLLREQGFGVIDPPWWGETSARLGVRLELESAELGPDRGAGRDGPDADASHLGLESLVDYRWRIAVGSTPLSLLEFENLVARRSPLVRIGGQWVEIDPEDARAVAKFIQDRPGGKIRVAEALRLAYATDPVKGDARIIGLSATGWVADVLGLGESELAMEDVTPPEGFKGELRPYQLKGLAWLAFLERFGLGACLADDMGLGKTIQVIALLLRERNRTGGVGPTLVVAPMSVVGNWRREVNRFAPSLKVLVHHGLGRAAGAEFVEAAGAVDAVVTTYALAHRDAELLSGVKWARVVLDEAQNVKNPAAKQTQSVRALPAPRRLALTGTPVENRLTELWSIMDFCNPGYLGPAADFRRRFSVPIERRHSRRRSEQLRNLVRPFVLRRLKTDPTVIADLPEKLESKEYCPLTPEQASLYEATVDEMLARVDRSEGVRRRGIVLATLVKLKQVCNHPAQMLGSGDTAGGGPPHASRSGKCIRLVEMLDEVVAAGDQALVFTQFREMGRILTAMLMHDLDREVLFLHGGTPQTAREAMVERFQIADGSAPVFVLSLKAGGVGMNLTAASHVFHFDRWWNPAVENQATDRAYRIGQTRTVQVHKFVVAGTLEERIDQMIEQKTELADNIIGSGEQWLTELSTVQLRDLLRLRRDSVGEE